MSDPSSALSDRHRIVRIVLQEQRHIRLTPQVENERRVALFDLIEDNHFALADGQGGPYVLHLGVAGERLAFDVRDADDRPIAAFAVPIADLRRVIKDYFLMCNSYFTAIKSMPRSRIEAIDMGRRGLHNEGADILRERLRPYVDIDRDTARRLFTLICVLHIRT